MGFGNIGIDLAKRLRPFDVKIIATKRSWSSASGVSFQNGYCDSLVDERGGHGDIYKFVSKSDIVVCCLALNKETVRDYYSAVC